MQYHLIMVVDWPVDLCVGCPAKYRAASPAEKEFDKGSCLTFIYPLLMGNLMGN